MRWIVVLMLILALSTPAAAQWVRPKKQPPAMPPLREQAQPPGVLQPGMLQDMPVPYDAPTTDPFGPCSAQDRARLETFNQLNDYISDELTSTQARQLLKRTPRAPEALIEEMTDTPEEIDFIAKLIVRCTPDSPADTP